MRTSPAPSALDGRASSVTTCGFCSCSSAESSIVMMRSPSGMNDDSTLSVVVLPVPVPPDTSTLSLPRTHASSTTATSMVIGAEGDQVLHLVGVGGELADGEHRAVHRQRRDDGVDAGAVGEAGVDHGRALVDAAADATDDAVDDLAVGEVVGEGERRALHTSPALDPDLVVGVAHDFGDGLVGEQRLERSVAERVLHDLVDEATTL